VAQGPWVDSKFAFVVSRRVALKAVERNKLKRRARAVIRKMLPDIKPHFAGIFFLKKESAKLSFQELEQSARGVLRKARIL
jgi:ribonuclease P protein component